MRQLNFYGFRKVKFSDSLRIDYQLEAATVHFWKFKHDKFRRGRKDLLKEIKRTSSAAAAVHAAKALVPCLPSSSPMATCLPVSKIGNPVGTTRLETEVWELRQKIAAMTDNMTEVRDLKQKIASMTVNIDQLAGMVKVSVGDAVKSGGADSIISHGNMAKLVEPETSTPGYKRKKRDSQVWMKQAATLPLMPVQFSAVDTVNSLTVATTPSSTIPNSIIPHSSGTLTEANPYPLGGAYLLPEPVVLAPLPAPSHPPNNDGFMDDLFKAFAEDRIIFPGLEKGPEGGNEDPDSRKVEYVETADNRPCTRSMQRVEHCSVFPGMNVGPESGSEGLAQRGVEYGKTNNNNPCPRLMQRIEESLSTIPRDMHEMVANRLIGAISKTQPIAASAGALFPALLGVPLSPHLPVSGDEKSPAEFIPSKAKDAQDRVAPAHTLPLIVATLKTILAEYGVAPECKSTICDQEGLAESLPMVRMHF